jgi:3-oxoacyl-[acyl-carrier protein] reductase
MTEPLGAAIVTGGSRGIGAAVCRRLARDGFGVVVNYAGSKDDAEAVVAEITAAGGRARAVQGDVSDPAAVGALFDAAETAFGGAGVLVNNAGVMRLGPLAEVDDATFDRHVAINLKGVFNGLREGARRIADRGRIVSMSTSVVGTSLPTYGVYAATKAAVEAMSRILAKELGPRGITVNVVAPGPIATDLFLEGKDQAVIARITSTIPLGRLGRPDDIAGTVSFLVGPDGGWVNGQVVRANGGMV